MKQKRAAETKVLSVLLIICCLPCCAGAQTEKPVARLFDTFGDVYPTYMAARLDGLAIVLQNQPNDRAFLVVYRSFRDLPGLSSRHLGWMRRYLLYRGFDSNRIVTVDGGTASCLIHEFWIGPPGATPKPREDAYSRGFVNTDVAEKYDEYFFTAPRDEGDSYSSEYENPPDGFAEALHKHPRSLGYIIAYDGYRIEKQEEEGMGGKTKIIRKSIIDPKGTAWKELLTRKAQLVADQRIPSSRIRLIYGGYRAERGLELWIVPPGARPPIPTPNVYPPPLKRKT
jgi:hypothetical protein